MATKTNRKSSSGPVSKGAGRQRELALASTVTGFLILLSTFAVIYSTHTCRTLYAQLQVLESAQWYLQEDYGRLLLEQSTWASHYRVEKVARADLDMRSPDLARYELVVE